MNTLALRFPRQLTLAALALLALAAPARATTYLDNLSGPNAGTLGLNSASQIAAIPFTTDNSAPAFYLSDITVSAAGSGSGSFFALQLYDTNGGVPGTLLATGVGTTPSVQADYVYTFSSLPLQPDTQYWIGFANLPGSSSSYDWTGTNTAPDLGTWTSNTTTIQFSSDDGASWFPFHLGFYPQIAVNATTTVPEPGTYAVLLALPALAAAAYFRRRRKA